MHVDVAIIGAGTAGLSARREVERCTQNYVVIDDGPLGTTCARVGCMPSKALIEAANTYHSRKKYPLIGLIGEKQVGVDFSQVMQHVRSLRDRFVGGVTKGMEAWQKTHLLRGRAKFLDRQTLKVDQKIIKAKSIIIATGSMPVIPSPWQAYSRFFLSTDDFFELSELKGKLAVIGLGVIGVELGQALSRLDVPLVAINRGKSIGGITHPALQDYILEVMSEEFPIYPGGVLSLSEKNDQLVINTQGQELLVDKALLAMGRKPRLEGLNFANTGLAVDKNGIPKFAKGTFRIADSHIYIAGDVTGERALLHEAADAGRIAGYNAVRGKDECFRRRIKLAITFCAPNIASIGESFAGLKEQKIDFVEGHVVFQGQGRAIIKREEKGMLKVFVEPTTGKLLGSELFAPDGEHLAHLLAWAMEAGLSVDRLLSLPFYHPVIEEGLRTALRHARNQCPFSPPPLETLRCQDAPVGG